MIILHTLTKEIWNEYIKEEYYGKTYIEKCGFIHCSDIDTYKNVAPNFKNETKEMVLLLIDTEKVEAEILWEDLDNCGRKYPHIYGLLNTNSIIGVLPHLWSEDMVWVMNDELRNL
ncbi:MAG: DUF952 domain-containing protein [Eubacteriales bacterium]